MITNCPHCSRPVANDEPVGWTSQYGWVPTACCTGENGPLVTGPKVMNHLHFYVSVIKDGKVNSPRLILGPYPSYQEADLKVSLGRKLAAKVDPKAPWYSYGVASSNGVHKTFFGLGEDGSAK